jgi:hypothetical protein
MLFFFFLFLLFLRSSGIGGKGSTEFVVKGSQKHLPQELIEELKAICQVFYFYFSILL